MFLIFKLNKKNACLIMRQTSKKQDKLKSRPRQQFNPQYASIAFNNGIIHNVVVVGHYFIEKISHNVNLLFCVVRF
jgi:hypothetical protein